MAELPDLDRLVADVALEAGDDDPLARLATATRVRDDLDELADAVVDHFVEEARQAGCSWTQVGAALGVSKQAAQQRHASTQSVARRLLGRLSWRRRSGGGGLFHRFTPAARRAVVLAQQEARALRHDHIGTEHLLLGVLAEPDGGAGRALASLDVTLEATREKVAQIVPPGSAAPAGHIPFTPRAKKALELSLRESVHLGHTSLGTEHILLALLRVRDGRALRVLEACTVDEARAREAIVSVLDGSA